MQGHFDAWHILLNKHNSLLDELLFSLEVERKAILANDIDALKESTLKKDKASRKINLIKQEITELKEQTAQSLSIPTPDSLQELFSKFKSDHQKQLLTMRQELIRKSKNIKKINLFNNSCLNTYVSFMDSFQSIMSIAKAETRTYSSSGHTHLNGRHSGRLFSRSL